MVHYDVIGQFCPSLTRLLALQLQPEHLEGGVILAKITPPLEPRGPVSYGGSTHVLYWGEGEEQDSIALRQNYFAVGNKTTCTQRRSRLRLATTAMSSPLANSNPPLSHPHPQKETLQDDGSPPLPPFLPRPKILLSKQEYKPVRRVVFQ
jgi:hypothetical protein